MCSSLCHWRCREVDKAKIRRLKARSRGLAHGFDMEVRKKGLKKEESQMSG